MRCTRRPVHRIINVTHCHDLNSVQDRIPAGKIDLFYLSGISPCRYKFISVFIIKFNACRSRRSAAAVISTGAASPTMIFSRPYLPQQGSAVPHHIVVVFPDPSFPLPMEGRHRLPSRSPLYFLRRSVRNKPPCLQRKDLLLLHILFSPPTAVINASTEPSPPSATGTLTASQSGK